MESKQAEVALELTNLKRIGKFSIQRLQEHFRAASDDLIFYQEIRTRLVAAGIQPDPSTEGMEQILAHRKVLAEGLLKSQESLMQSARESIFKNLCPFCFGEGEAFISSPTPGSLLSVSTMQTCSTCNGSGLRPT